MRSRGRPPGDGWVSQNDAQNPVDPGIPERRLAGDVCTLGRSAPRRDQDDIVEELSEPWVTALTLAWDAMLAGTTPVGCVVLDGAGRVATQGRGRRYAPDSIQGQLSNSHLAHAELNALAQLTPTRRYEDHVVLTTLEPCALCVGAAVTATVGRVEYAGADPYGGAAHLQLRNGHTARLMPEIVGPARGTLGTIGALLHYTFYLERNPSGSVAAAYRESMTSFVREVEGAGLTQEVLRLKSEQRGLVDVMSLFA
jgi:tRNA(Arg) A34 adenosine deaminase TadA